SGAARRWLASQPSQASTSSGSAGQTSGASMSAEQAAQRGRQRVAEALEEQGAHVRVETLGLLAGEREQAQQLALAAQRDQRHGTDVGRSLAEPRQRLEIGRRAAVRPAQVGGLEAQLLADGLEDAAGRGRG